MIVFGVSFGTTKDAFRSVRSSPAHLRPTATRALGTRPCAAGPYALLCPSATMPRLLAPYDCPFFSPSPPLHALGSAFGGLRCCCRRRRRCCCGESSEAGADCTPSVLFRDFFAEHGELLECELMFGRDGKSRGFGFVLYKDEENNKKILGMEGLTLEGRALDIKLRNSQPVGGGRFRGGGPPKSKKVFIGRLSDEVESADLREHFEQFGKIIDIFMPMVSCPASLLLPLLLLLCLLSPLLSSHLSSLTSLLSPLSSLLMFLLPHSPTPPSPPHKQTFAIATPAAAPPPPPTWIVFRCLSMHQKLDSTSASHKPEALDPKP
jgi:RNA-binding protein Musashi